MDPQLCHTNALQAVQWCCTTELFTSKTRQRSPNSSHVQSCCVQQRRGRGERGLGSYFCRFSLVLCKNPSWIIGRFGCLLLPCLFLPSVRDRGFEMLIANFLWSVKGSFELF